jgi:phage/plasmid-associated DNA primase
MENKNISYSMDTEQYYQGYIYYSVLLKAEKQNGKITKKPLNMPLKWTELNKPIYDKNKNGIALLTGKVNNIFVIDYDDKSKYERDVKLYPEISNYVVKTNKGFHTYFKYSDDLEKIKSNRKLKVDFQGDKKCVYAPPTKYKDNEGNIYKYEKITDTTLEDLKEPSKELIKYLNNTYKKETECKISRCLNEMFEPFDWTWTEENDKVVIRNNSKKCLVSGEMHNSINHSCLFINKKGYSVINCHSHKPSKKLSYKNTPLLKTLKQHLKLKDDKDKVLNSLEKLRNYLYKISVEKGYKKEGDIILKPLKNVPTHMEDYMELNDFLDKIFENREDEEIYDLYRKTPRNKEDLVRYLKSYNDDELPKIQRLHHIYSFNNGYYDINEMKFYSFQEGKKYSNICSSVYINKDFVLNNLDTPNWDKLIKHHIKDEEIYDIFNALIGRLFYPLKQYDNWQVQPFLKGSANTGKSTIIEIIQSFFHTRDIGSISSNFEGTFGLQNIYDKRVIICPDIPFNIKKVLDASIFQSCVSGEYVNVPRKNKTSLCVEFKSPMLWAGNFLPNYNDKSRSVSRRIAIFDINNEVKEKDTTLKQRILDTEKVALFVKFITAYHRLREKVKNITFEDWGRKLGITYFDNQTEEFRKESDYLYQFITNPPGVNKTRNSNIWIEYKEGELTELETFKKKFKSFVRFKHNLFNYRWSNTSDISTLHKEGYIIYRVHICASCNKKALKGCCENYNANNRRRKYVIENMVIRNEFIDDDEYD